MKDLFKTIRRIAAAMAVAATLPLATSCADDDMSKTMPDYDPRYKGKVVFGNSDYNVESQAQEVSIAFDSDKAWTATLTTDGEETSWASVSPDSGEPGEGLKVTVKLDENESTTNARQTKLTITTEKGEAQTVTIAQNYKVHLLDPTAIADYAKYLCPSAGNEHFEKGPDFMLRQDAYYSWHRMRQSEHFFVFWSPEFGADPNAETVKESMRVDVDDLLAKAEQFYTTNVERLGMAVTGQGKSMLDKYKMQIYLIYQDEWLATGSGYDDKIGALWVNPSTCKPVGSTIAHEIGHSFQYQVSADLLATGQTTHNDKGILPVGFRYGFGPDGQGGCAFWEQCAQWQSFQDYPQEAFTQGGHVQVWLKNHHRHVSHEWHRYASYWFPYYYTQKHGLSAYARLWRESRYPEDVVEAYRRLFCGGSLATAYADLYDYAARCANYDFAAVHRYLTPAALNHSTTLYRADGWYQVAYASCPGTTGFNLVPLNVPAGGTQVSATIEALAPGSSLAADDPGTVTDADGNAKGTVKTYNAQANKATGLRYGYVAIVGDKSHYGEMHNGKGGTVSFTVPAGTTRLYLCVLGAPTTYNRHAWDDVETNDEQWPYRVKFVGTDLLGHVDLPAGEPENVALSHTLQCDAASADYVQGMLRLLDNGDMGQIARAFRMQPSAIAAATLAAGSVPEGGPAEGQIAVALTQPDGTLSYAYSANGTGFWIAADGKAGSWGTAPVFFEYDGGSFALGYGHKPGVPQAGKTYTIRPTLVYNHGGKLYKAVVTVQMKY